jgi:hypothetical protein
MVSVAPLLSRLVGVTAVVQLPGAQLRSQAAQRVPRGVNIDINRGPLVWWLDVGRTVLLRETALLRNGTGLRVTGRVKKCLVSA